MEGQRKSIYERTLSSERRSRACGPVSHWAGTAGAEALLGVREQHGLKVREEDSAPGW